MAKKAKDTEVNKSQAIRELLKENPKIKAKDAVTALAEKGVQVKASLFYIVKGNVLGKKKRRKKGRKQAMEVAVAFSNGTPDAVATIRSIKEFAAGVGGLRKLKALVDALNE
jgi:hypothetical protein